MRGWIEVGCFLGLYHKKVQCLEILIIVLDPIASQVNKLILDTFLKLDSFLKSLLLFFSIQVRAETFALDLMAFGLLFDLR